MRDFVKITEELLEKDDDYEKYLVDKVAQHRRINIEEYDIGFCYALEDCESPIEQLLALELERIGLKCFYKYNPFIDVVEIEKQITVECDNNKYRVDFYIPVEYKNQENITFIVECDGHEFHQKTKEQVEYDNKRQRDLQKAGYEVIRFSGSEIWHSSYRCACEIKNIILSKCKYIVEE